jgi:DNA-binding NarL/FixJ family response regulator
MRRERASFTDYAGKARKGILVPKILVADNHATLRKRVADAVTESVPGASVDSAEDGETALAMIRDANFDLVLLDISMPGRGGLKVLEGIQSCRPGLPVLILSMHPEEEYAARAFRAGAAGFVTKRSAPEELAGAVRTVLAGGRYVSASLAGTQACERETAEDGPLPKRLAGRRAKGD